MRFKISPELREALNEVERINADMQQVFATIAELEAKADEASANMYRAAGGILKVAGQSQGSQMGVVLGEVGGMLALAGVAFQGAAKLWGGIKRSWALRKILPEKQAIAEEKRPILLEMIPKLESHSRRLQACLDQFGSESIDGSMLDKFDPLWSEICDVVSGYFRCCFIIAHARWVMLQFDAWDEDRHDSGQLPPSEGAWGDAIYLYLLNSIDRHVDHAQPASLPLGAIYVAHLDIPSAAIKSNPTYSKIISLIARRRIKSLLLPFSDQSRCELAFYSKCLTGSKVVGSRVRNTFLAWFGAFATALGAGFFVNNMNPQEALDTSNMPTVASQTSAQSNSAEPPSAPMPASSLVVLPAPVVVRAPSETPTPPRAPALSEAPPPVVNPPPEPPREANRIASGEGVMETLRPTGYRASSHVVLRDHSFPPSMAFDGTHETAWNEGARGPGVGQWIEATFDTPARIREIDVSTGWDATSRAGTDLFHGNAHLRRVLITFSSGRAITREVGEDDRVLEIVGLDEVTTWVRFTALAVYRGFRWEDLAISEIAFRGSLLAR